MIGPGRHAARDQQLYTRPPAGPGRHQAGTKELAHRARVAVNDGRQPCNCTRCGVELTDQEKWAGESTCPACRLGF